MGLYYIIYIYINARVMKFIPNEIMIMYMKAGLHHSFKGKMVQSALG